MKGSLHKWKALKEKLKAITRKTAQSTFAERIAKLKELHRGWINYFRMASMQTKLKEIDGWLRNRLRYCIWKDCSKGIPLGEEAGTEKKESDSSWHSQRSGLCVDCTRR